MTPRTSPTAGALTVSVEDYLKVIYELELGGGPAATNEIAARLHVAPASVTGMVRRLAEQKLLDYERYRGVTLTTAGRRAALTTIRRHRVIEAYLAIALGYPWDRVHAEAEHLEHAASDELVDRMAAAIGEPLTDPHGAPIPTREGLMDERRHRALHDLPMGEVALVASVSDRDPEQLRHLADLEIRPGASLTVIARAPLNGPLTIAVSHGPGKPPRRHDVGAVLAQQVFVEAAPPRRRPRKSL